MTAYALKSCRRQSISAPTGQPQMYPHVAAKGRHAGSERVIILLQLIDYVPPVIFRWETLLHATEDLSYTEVLANLYTTAFQLAFAQVLPIPTSIKSLSGAPGKHV